MLRALLLCLGALAVVLVCGLGARGGVPPARRLGGDLQFPPSFFFGVASAPAQSEDKLNDAWLQFAKEGHVHAWDVPHAEDRLRFWSDPGAELDLVAETESTVFRLGLDWGRVMPNGTDIDEEAMAHYGEILQKAKKRGLKIMLTLFHHSAPAWVTAAVGGPDTPQQGWTTPAILPFFAKFADAVAERYGYMVDYWTTFNEPHVFAGFTYCVGMWPPGPEKNMAQQVQCLSPGGAFGKAMKNMAQAHNDFAQRCKKAATCQGKLGVANNVGYEVPLTPMDWPAVKAIQATTKFVFQDSVDANCDFVGINYYGREWIHGAGPVILPDWEYSESGRCVDPEGLYVEVSAFWQRYKKPIVVTENGISDATDVLRPSYLLEHLAALHRALQDGIQVEGYVHWTTSDNWEWVDGYCPKFGMASVDRANGFRRVKRNSFGVFAAVAGSHTVTAAARDAAWALVADAQRKDETRPFCRAADGKGSLDKPVQRPFAKRDWRFRPDAQTEVVV